MCISCEISECEGGPCMFGPMNPFQKYMAKTMSSIATRGAAVDAAVATLESGHNRHCNKLKKLEKRADKNDSEQVCRG